MPRVKQPAKRRCLRGLAAARGPPQSGTNARNGRKRS